MGRAEAAHARVSSQCARLRGRAPVAFIRMLVLLCCCDVAVERGLAVVFMCGGGLEPAWLEQRGNF